MTGKTVEVIYGEIDVKYWYKVPHEPTIEWVYGYEWMVDRSFL